MTERERELSARINRMIAVLETEGRLLESLMDFTSQLPCDPPYDWDDREEWEHASEFITDKDLEYVRDEEGGIIW